MPSRRMQVTALLLLVVLLFPVISVTDDLMATPAMAESEHTARPGMRSDLEHRDLLHTGVLLYASPASLAFLAPPAPVAFLLASPPAIANATRGVARSTETRPPPHPVS